MQPPEIDLGKLDAIIDRHKKQKWGLIPLLQNVQETYGYVPPETIEPIAAALNLFPSQVQGVITFYSGFSLKPKGKYVCRVCRGTACHVKGGRSILRLMQKELNQPGLSVYPGNRRLSGRLFPGSDHDDQPRLFR